MKCLIFDTETTGLPPQTHGQDIRDYLEVWPYLMQLTYIIYDLDTMRVEKIYNKYVDIPSTELDKIHLEIDKNKTEIEIYKEKIKLKYNVNDYKKLKKAEKTVSILSENVKRWKSHKKISIQQANYKFFSELEKVDLLVAHNISFDYKMMLVTAMRHPQDQDKNIMMLEYMGKNNKCFCTMKEGKKICKCFKYPPSLTKTYQQLFGYEPNETKLHDSLFDVVITLRVFVKIITTKDICDEKNIEDKKTKKIIEMIKES